MRQAGMSGEDVDTLVWKNPAASSADTVGATRRVVARSALDWTDTFDGNSVLRGQTPDAMSRPAAERDAERGRSRAPRGTRPRGANLPPRGAGARAARPVAVHLAALPQIEREVRGGGRREFGPVTIIEAAFRDCDLAAAVLLEAGGAHGRPDALFELFRRGDHEERRMI
ncbi:MAG: hypothetical protein R3F20_15895 [Planctomycetota bacterium]